MSRFIRKSTKKAGGSPGTLVHVGEKKTDPIHLSLLHYDAQSLTEKALERFEQALPFLKPETTTWIDIDGIHDIAFMERIGQHYDTIHPLTLEDVLNTTQRPKAEIFDDYLFIVMKMLHYDVGQDLIISEQISLILGKEVLISFQEKPGDVFEPVRERIRRGKGRIRSQGCDYLAYALVDAIVDNYYTIFERMGERLESLEEVIDDHPDASVLDEIHAIRQELILLRKQVWPLREVLSHFIKAETPFIGETTALFMRDVYDHTIQAIDTIESFRDNLSGLQDLYLSIMGHRMNEVMKVLTIMATIFIPLTFVAGIYGMNFVNMPELTWRWGYLLVWIIFLVVAVGMLIFFRHKKWL